MEDKKQKNNIISIVLRVVIYTYLFLFFLVSILHIPAVQRFVTNIIVEQLSGKIGGDILIGHTTFDLFRGAQIHDIVVLGSKVDTLAVVDNISISPKGTLLSLVSGKPRLNDILIGGVDIRISIDKGAETSNWGQAVSGSDNQPPEQPSDKFPVELSYLRIDDLSVKLVDENRGQTLLLHTRTSELVVNEMIKGDSIRLDFGRLMLDQPMIMIESEDLPNEEMTTLEDTLLISAAPGIHFLLDQLTIIDGSVRVSRRGDTQVDLSHVNMILTDIDYMNPLDWRARAGNISFDSGKDQLRYLTIQSIQRNFDELEVDKLEVRLNNSFVKLDAIVSDLKDDFDVSEARFEMDVSPSSVRLRDFYRVIPVLAGEVGGDMLGSERIQVSGDFTWDQNILEGREILLWIGRQQHFDGDIVYEKGKNLATTVINANVRELSSNMDHLNILSRKLQLPKEVLRLGDVRFEGTYDGYLDNFVANGQVFSLLGDADIDIQFDLSGTGEDAIGYNGMLILKDFDMAGFMNNNDFGFINAQVDITDGSGSSLLASHADLSARIASLEYKNYTYRDAQYKGKLSSQVINGKFEIKDDYVDFEFEGIVDLSEEVPLFDFRVLAQEIDFCALNLATFPCRVSFASDVSFRGKSFDTMEGRGLIGDIVLEKDSSILRIANIDLRSARIRNGMQLELKSDFIDFDISGVFNLFRMTDYTIEQLLANTKAHNETWKIKRDTSIGGSQKFAYALYIKEATPLFSFLGLDLEEHGRGIITGKLDTYTDEVELKAHLPKIRYKDLKAENIRIDLLSDSSKADIVVRLEHFKQGNRALEEAGVTGNFYDQFFDWTVYGRTPQEDIISITAKSVAQEEGYFTTITEHQIIIDSNEWYFLPNEGFGIYPNQLSLKDFTITDGDVSITLNDVERKGLRIHVNNFELGFVNSIINYDKLSFSGKVNSSIKVVNVFKDRSLLGYLRVDDFLINGDPYGQLLFKAQRAGEGMVDVDISITQDTQVLSVLGYVDLANEFINMDVNIEDYPMKFFEYIIDEGISETVGTTDVSAKLHGDFSDLKLSGKGIIKNGGTRIDFLGAFYRMEDQVIKISESFIDLNGVELIDAMGNIAVISGGLNHHVLADIRADAQITSPRFIGLSTTKEDNPLYYGIGVGKLDISFLGPFEAIDIRVAASVGELSQLIIPITSTQYGFEESFIKFDYQKSVSDTTSTSTLVDLLQDKGADFEMNLTFTPDARVSVIYDETTSNVLNANGEGNLRIRVKRDGDFTIHGSYSATSGDYLFTSYGAIAKPFNIKPGGTVVWTGDPINASLNIVAEYPALRVPLTNFLAEYSDIAGVDQGELNQRQEVDLTLILGGNLYNPTIEFDIDFPNLVGPVKTIALSKLRTLKASENGINNQVVGLMVFRDFLRENNPLAGISANTIGQTTGSTVTQFITSQLSVMVSDYLSQRLDDDGFITGIDLEIALANNAVSSQGQGFGGFFNPDEVQVNLRNRIRNGEVYFNVGGNYVRKSQFGTADNYVTGDFSIDWFITEDRRLKLRFHSNFDYDEARAAGRQRYGLGINFRREFGNITNFEAVLEDLIKDMNKVSATR